MHNALIDVTADLNAATSIALQQSDNISVAANLTAGTSISVLNATQFIIDSTSNTVQLQSNGGDITFGSDVVLAGGNLVTLDANGGGVSLQNLSDAADSNLANLSIISDDDISFTSIDLADAAVTSAGSLSLKFNDDGDASNNIQMDIDSRFGALGSLTASGTDAGDSIVVSQNLQTTVGALVLQDALIDVNANLSSATSITLQRSNLVDVAANMTAGTSISVLNANQFIIDATSSARQLQSFAGDITFGSDVALAGGNFVTLDANGGGVSLHSVSGVDDGLVADLTVTSDDSISFTNIDLADSTAGSSGHLALTINADGAGAAQTLNIQTGQTIGDVGQLTLSGGAATDAINISSSVTTSVAEIVVHNALIDVTADLNAATSIALQQSDNISVAANLTAGTSISVLNATQFIIDSTSNTVQLQSNGGDITFGSDVALAGGNFVTLDANGGGVSLHSVSGRRRWTGR